jgi:ABC-type transport system substrate-binding protein
MENGKMKEITFALSVILVAFMTFGLVSAVFAAAQTPSMQIHIYLDPDTENTALQNGEIDINDWPLTKDWIDAWALMPTIMNLRDYVELGMMEIDMNNQQWPTGDSNSKFYTASRPESVKSVEFRKAVACLLDRDKIVTDVLKGMGYRMDVPLPPFQSAYADMVNYSASGYIYNYDKARAESILDAAGFTINPVTHIRVDPVRGGDLQPVKFYIRQDDPNRRAAGEMLVAELLSEGIPVQAIITERTVCYKNVMVLYDYQLYTGGWSLTTIPDQYHDLFSSFTYYGPTIGWSQNYPGFCNHEFDSWALQVKYCDTIADCQAAAKAAGYLFLKYCAMVPMYCSKAVKAYRTYSTYQWAGVINNGGFGIDNYWTFLNMYQVGTGGDNRIDWGFKSDVEQLNQVSSEWLWDQNVLGLIYESLIGNNPFSLDPSEFFLAESGYIGTWNATPVGGTDPATFVNFTLRSGVTWHNTTGNPRAAFTAYAVNFSFVYQKTCGPGIAWNYPNLAAFDHCEVYDDLHVAIFYTQKSAWAYQWAGGLPMINPDIWGRITPGMATKNFDPATADINGNGVTDLQEDGTGAWMYDTYYQGNWVTLDADPNYYLSASFISTRLAEMFHEGAGDVNRDGVVSILDLSYMARSLGRTFGVDPSGQGWYDYNADCDLNGDGTVDYMDLGVTSANYGRTAG